MSRVVSAIYHRSEGLLISSVTDDHDDILKEFGVNDKKGLPNYVRLTYKPVRALTINDKDPDNWDFIVSIPKKIEFFCPEEPIYPDWFNLEQAREEFWTWIKAMDMEIRYCDLSFTCDSVDLDASVQIKKNNHIPLINHIADDSTTTLIIGTDKIFEGNIDLSKCYGLLTIPNGLHTKYGGINLFDCKSLVSIGDNLYASTDIFLSGCKSLVSIGDNLYCGENFYIDYCEKLKMLPKGLRVKGNLFMAFSGIIFMPEDKRIDGKIYA